MVKNLRVFDEAISDDLLEGIDSMEVVYIRMSSLRNGLEISEKPNEHLEKLRKCYRKATENIQTDKDGYVQNVFMRMKKEGNKMTIEIFLLKTEATKLKKDLNCPQDVPFIDNTGLEYFLKPDYEVILPPSTEKTFFNREVNRNRSKTAHGREPLPWMVSTNFQKKIHELQDVPAEGKQTNQEKERLVSNVFVFRIVREKKTTGYGWESGNNDRQSDNDHDVIEEESEQHVSESESTANKSKTTSVSRRESMQKNKNVTVRRKTIVTVRLRKFCLAV